MKFLNKIIGKFISDIPNYPNITIDNKAIVNYVELVRDAENLALYEIKYKICKMYAFSEVVYTYTNGNKIHRFYDMNMMLDNNTIKSIWRSKKQYRLIYPNKNKYDKWKVKYSMNKICEIN